VSAPSHDQAYDQGRVVALVGRPDLLLAPGDVADLPIRYAAAMADLIVGWAAVRIAALYLDGAEGDDLHLLGRDRTGLEAFEASEAVGEVTFAHTAGVSGTIPAGFRVASVVAEDGSFVTHTTDLDIVWGIGDTARTVAITAATAGAAGNVGIGALSRMLDTPFASGFTVTNASASAGGNEAETDPEYRERVRTFNQTLRRGTLAALEFGALQVPQVKRATVVEGGPAVVTVYVTDGAGGSSAGMVAAVAAELENWRAAGVVVTVAGGSIFNQAITLSLTVRAGTDIAALVTRVQQAVTSAVNALKIGETLYRTLIASAARAVDPAAIADVVVTVPAADVAPAANQIIRTSAVSVS
jgi:hypothetical protein